MRLSVRECAILCLWNIWHLCRYLMQNKVTRTRRGFVQSFLLNCQHNCSSLTTAHHCQRIIVHRNIWNNVNVLLLERLLLSVIHTHRWYYLVWHIKHAYRKKFLQEGYKKFLYLHLRSECLFLLYWTTPFFTWTATKKLTITRVLHNVSTVSCIVTIVRRYSLCDGKNYHEQINFSFAKFYIKSVCFYSKRGLLLTIVYWYGCLSYASWKDSFPTAGLERVSALEKYGMVLFGLEILSGIAIRRFIKRLASVYHNASLTWVFIYPRNHVCYIGVSYKACAKPK